MKAISNRLLLLSLLPATLALGQAGKKPVPVKDTTEVLDSTGPKSTPDSSTRAVDTADTAEDYGGDEDDDVSEDARPTLAFLIPAEGDVMYAADIKVVAYVQGVTPTGMLAVLDGYSYNRPLQLEDGMLSLELPGMRAGVHELKFVLLNDQNQIQVSRTVRFFVRVPEPRHKAVQGKFRQFGRVMTQLDWKGAESKGRVLKQSELHAVNDTTLAAGKGEAPISESLDGAAEAAYTVKYDLWEGYIKGLLRTDENRFRQSTDRLSGRISYGPWVTVRGGDIYPTYNSLILNGTRVRGGEASAAIVTDDGEQHWAYAKAVTGETKRAIPAYLAEYDTGSGPHRLDTISGTPSQTLTAFRLGAGGGQVFDLGLTVMRVGEQIGDSLTRVINTQLHGVQPVDNLVTGLDMRLGLWDGRMQVFGEWAGSLYTRDKSIGAYSTDSFDVAINPKKFESIFVFNPSTRGWQYLVSNDSVSPDAMGFIQANSTYEAGVTSSIPFSGIVAETELRYSHLGLEYHSEGNPFLGTNPGDGFSLQQRLVVLENRLFLGVEVDQFQQDLGLYQQEERGFKGEVRYVPGGYRPAMWANASLTVRAPKGSYPYQFNQQFTQLNVGGFQELLLSPGRLHASLLYGFTRSVLELKSNPQDPTADSLLNFPATQTHIVNTGLQFKFRGSDFTPKLSYTFASNGVQAATHNVAVGFQNSFFSQQLRGDVEMLVGQYPSSLTQNDLSLGEDAGLSVKVGEDQSIRFNEKWIHYGDRASINAGAYYEKFF